MSSSLAISFLESQQVLREIKKLFTSSEEIDVAVAYLKDSGYQEIREDVIGFLRKRKTLRLLVGLANYCITDPEPLEDLLTFQKSLTERKKLQLKYYSNMEFHPKLMIFRERSRVCIIVGSSNFTAGGLGGNIEANLMISGVPNDNEITKILRFFEGIWTKGAKKITEKIITDYKTTKLHSHSWNAKRVRQSRIPQTTIPIKKQFAIDASVAYILGILLARGEVSKRDVTIRIPCRKRIIRESHKKFAQTTLKQMIESTLNEKVAPTIRYNAQTQSLDIVIASKTLQKILGQLRIPVNRNFGTNGFVPRKILHLNVNVLRSFLQGYGDSCATIGAYISGRARVTLNLDIHNYRVIEDLVDAFGICSIPLADVDLPPSGRVFNNLERKLNFKKVNVTRGTHTPQIRIWGDVYSKKIGFRNDYLCKELKKLL